MQLITTQVLKEGVGYLFMHHIGDRISITAFISGGDPAFSLQLRHKKYSHLDLDIKYYELTPDEVYEHIVFRAVTENI